MSIWNKKEIKTKRDFLNKNIEVDILIVGAGITGMTTAYYLQDNDVCVVDANTIGHGVTLNTTAKINYFQERIYTKIMPREKSIKYLHSQLMAIDSIKKIIEDNDIDCDFKKVKSFVFANTKKEVQPLLKEVNFLVTNGIDVKEDKLPNKITSYCSYYVADTYIFNPIKYLQGLYDILTKKISIYENTKIIKIDKIKDYYICFSNFCHIKANKVILACQYPYFNYPFLLPLKSSIEKSYIIVSKVSEDKNFTCISSNYPIYSCRYYEDEDGIYQISLAESHNTSVKQNDSYHFKRVKEIFGIHDKDIVMKYSNTDIMTVDYMPYIGRLKDNIFIACGYNTWGMTNGVLAAKIISDLVLNIENEYSNVFSPNRFNVSNIIKFPYIMATSIKAFLGPKVNKYKSWYKKNIKFIHKNGKSLAIYIDKKNREHIIYNKCPHLGCSLIFNEKELTWDCPCHSSRFNIDGKCIKGPSNYDISYKSK